MRILLLSDLHLEFGGFRPDPQACAAADVVVLAGDIDNKQHGVAWAKKHFTQSVIYVVGNHEHYGNSLGRTPKKLKEAAAGSNVHVLHNESVIIGGVRFLGATLWTDYRLTGNQPLAEFDAMQTMTDFKQVRNERYRRVRPVDFLAEHARSRSFLDASFAESFDGKTVVVTHHAPSIRSVHPRFLARPGHLSSAYASDLERMLGAENAALWLHGHTHNSFDYDAYGTRVVCNPRGYAPDDINPDFDPGLLLTF